MNSLRNMTIGTRLSIGFGVLLATLAAVLVVGVLGISRIGASADRVIKEDWERSRAAQAFERHAQATFVAALKTLQKTEQTPFTTLRTQVADARAGMEKTLAELRALGDADGARLDRIDAGRKGYVATLAQVMEFAESGKVVEGESVVHRRLEPQFEALSKDIAELVAHNTAQVVRSAADQSSAIAMARHTMLWLGVLGVVAGAALAYWVMRSLTVPLAQAVAVAKRVSGGHLDGEIVVEGRDEVGQLLESLATMQRELRAMIGAIAQSAVAVSESASKMAIAADESIARAQARSEATGSTAAAVEQMTVSISQVAEHAQTAADVVERSSELAREGESIVRAASGEMNSIAQSVKHGSELVETLNRRSAEISSIVRVIKDIADQTNLLALNAAIEAARAGEQGRGFAVVADEVRKLAERTGTATSEIGAMIDAIQRETSSVVETMQAGGDKVTHGVKLADDAAAALEKINAQVMEAAQSVTAIASATREQSSASSEIARNVERIAQMTEESSAAADHNAHSAQNLDQLASALRTHTARFKI